MKKQLEVVLEKGNNSHVFKGKGARVVEFENGEVFIKESEGAVHHGEHHITVTGGNSHKFNQMESNPVTGDLQRAYD